MVTFTYLNKSEKDLWLPRLFDLLYQNMESIAPLEQDCRGSLTQFLAEVSPALDKAPRQIILCLDGNDLLGYLQFYIRDTLLMVEEIQIRKDHQRTFLFYRLCRHLINVLPKSIAAIEAFADKSHLNSQNIMHKLGMEVIVDDCSSYPHLFHLRGQADTVKKYFSRMRK